MSLIYAIYLIESLHVSSSLCNQSFTVGLNLIVLSTMTVSITTVSRGVTRGLNSSLYSSSTKFSHVIVCFTHIETNKTTTVIQIFLNALMTIDYELDHITLAVPVFATATNFPFPKTTDLQPAFNGTEYCVQLMPSVEVMTP